MTGINLWQFGLKDPLFHHPWQNMWRNWIILMMNDLGYLYQICILMIGMLIQGWCENIQEYSMHKLNEFDDKEGMSSRVYFKVRHWDIVSLKLKLSHSITVTKTDCPTATYILTLWVFDFLGLTYTEICPTLLSRICLHMVCGIPNLYFVYTLFVNSFWVLLYVNLLIAY